MLYPAWHAGPVPSTPACRMLQPVRGMLAGCETACSFPWLHVHSNGGSGKVPELLTRLVCRCLSQGSCLKGVTVCRCAQGGRRRTTSQRRSTACPSLDPPSWAHWLQLRRWWRLSLGSRSDPVLLRQWLPRGAVLLLYLKTFLHVLCGTQFTHSRAVVMVMDSLDTL